MVDDMMFLVNLFHQYKFHSHFSHNMNEHPVLKEAVARYEEEYGSSPKVKVFAPGRVNLIGKAYIT